MGDRRRGVLLLTERRSGSTWLSSLARNAQLGEPNEWIRGNSPHGLSARTTPWETYFQTTLDRATAGTVGFYIKIFPSHLYQAQLFLKRDFIREVLAACDTTVIRLTRRDRLRQAISHARASQTKQWTSNMEVQQDAEYDFERIARAYFSIGRSYQFWESYVELLGIEARHFVYEDLLGDPMPFLEHVARAMGAPKPEKVESSMTVLRNDETEVWRKRFLEEMQTRSFVEESWISPPIPNPANVIRFVRRQHPKPFGYSF